MAINNRVLLIIISIITLIFSSSDAFRLQSRLRRETHGISRVGRVPRARVPRVAHVDPAIRNICAVARDPILCITSIAPFLDGKNDPMSVLIKEISATTRTVEGALAKAKNLLRVPSNKGTPAQCLKGCIEEYESAIFDLKRVTGPLLAQDFQTVDTYLTAIATSASTCDDGFDEMQIGNSLKGVDEIIKKLATNCLIIRKKFVTR